MLEQQPLNLGIRPHRGGRYCPTVVIMYQNGAINSAALNPIDSRPYPEKFKVNKR
jgi:hypothetical protein